MAFVCSSPCMSARHANPSSGALSPLAAPSPRRAQLTRRALLAALAAAATGATVGDVLAEAGKSTASGLVYVPVKTGTGPRAVIGDLVGIRFKGSHNGKVFDNLFESKEPYFYRCGSENILKGIDEAVQLMHVGDVYDLTLPPSLAFGKKGRRASAGKASIPPDSEVSYTLELSSIPGKEQELLEVVDLVDEE